MGKSLILTRPTFGYLRQAMEQKFQDIKMSRSHSKGYSAAFLFSIQNNFTRHSDVITFSFSPLHVW